MKQLDPYAPNTPSDAQVDAMEKWREHCRRGDALIRELSPACRERSLTVTALEEACMWGNKAINQRDD